MARATARNRSTTVMGFSGLLLVVAVSVWAAPNGKQPLLEAARRGDVAAIETLLAAGADPNQTDPSGASALHWAAYQGEAEIAEKLSKSGARVDAANTFGVRPLQLAARTGSTAVAEVLLRAGADPNNVSADGETALMLAARTGDTALVSALISNGADVNARTRTKAQTALMHAAAMGHTEAVELLIRAGAEVAARTAGGVPPTRKRRDDGEGVGQYGGKNYPADGAHGRRNIMNSPAIRLPVPGGFTPLLFAIRGAHLDTALALLEAGADINDTLPDGTSALHLATINAFYELGVQLLELGANPNVDGPGYTALHAVTWVRRPNIGFNTPGPLTSGMVDSLQFVKALVVHGANINARMTRPPNNGYRTALNRVGATPLLLAAKYADRPLMELLLSLGADPSLTNEDETTVLMVAAGVGMHSNGEDPGTEEEALECVKLALELGGDVNARNLNGETPLHGAAYRGANSIAQLLVDRGADTFMVRTAEGWTPWRIAKGVHRTVTYKEFPETAVLFEKMMSARGLSVEAADAPAVPTIERTAVTK